MQRKPHYSVGNLVAPNFWMVECIAASEGGQVHCRQSLGKSCYLWLSPDISVLLVWAGMKLIGLRCNKGPQQILRPNCPTVHLRHPFTVTMVPVVWPVLFMPINLFSHAGLKVYLQMKEFRSVLAPLCRGLMWLWVTGLVTWGQLYRIASGLDLETLFRL